jgi:prolipoprotein diacylglyceryl transferase
MLATIPSPSSGTLEIGPLQLNAYGLMIAIGVIAAVWLAGRRFEEKGIGTRDDMSYIALWAVPAGVIGARLYHVATDWQLFEDDPGKIVRIWEGGLGIPGGILLGVVVGVLAGRHRHVPLGWGLNCVAPALALAQAIGRIGNWWNQELFGRPTDLPWALEVSDEKAIAAGYPVGTTFHPTFLYESLWNVGLMFVLLWIDRRFRLWPGRLLAFYTLGYGLGRFWIEGLRIDPAKEGGGLRLNQWMALVLIVGSLAFLLIDWARHRGQEAPLPPALQPAVADEPTESVEPIEPVDGADPVTD